MAAALAAQPLPKREFRGAWLHVIGQSQYRNRTPAAAKEYIREQLDLLQDAGCNAVIFQVRPTADAMYKSDLEPWSTWLTGKRGKAPSEDWDPLQFTLQEAHDRGMEFHAWLNPYRVTSDSKEVLPADHISKKHPERFVKFNGQTFFDPAYQENRDFICEVVRDITSRYDVDAIHIDDYFYPYPANGKRFEADDASYAKFGNGMERRAWRRHNVDLLIEQLYTTIKETKPWVRFGVSPFGIWRNKSSDARGSNSSGLQNYDDLYADVLLWMDKGWVDYIVPQLYWSLDMKAAPSRHLAHWWNDHTPSNVQLYIGWDINRTMTTPDPKAGDKNELATKVKLSRELPNVKGNVWWHGYWLTGNHHGVADSLINTHQRTLALPPVYKEVNINRQGKPQAAAVSSLPPSPKGLAIRESGGISPAADEAGYILSWQPVIPKGVSEDVIRYAVYEFLPEEDPDIENTEALIAVTNAPSFTLGAPPRPGTTYAVTALDRLNRESRPALLQY